MNVVMRGIHQSTGREGESEPAKAPTTFIVDCLLATAPSL